MNTQTEPRYPSDDVIEEIARRVLAEGYKHRDMERRFARAVIDEYLRHAPQPAQPQQLQTCNCRWDGDVQVQECTLHESHLLAIHEWAGRAKAAEAKLAEQPTQQEPVAWIDPKHLDWLAQSPDNLTGAGLAARQRSADMVSLYTSPPTLLLAQRQSRSDVKPLTDDQMWQIWNSQGDDAMEQQSAIAFARAIEAAHGIKGDA